MARLTLIILSLAFVSSSVLACSLCGTAIKRNTFGQDMDRSQVVLYGKVIDSRLSTDPRALPGTGMSDFVPEKVVKGEFSLIRDKKMELPGYIPVLEPKTPPAFLMFFDRIKGELAPLGGREVRSSAVLEYASKAQVERAKKDRVAALLFYAKYLGHVDDSIAEDAFLEFAKSTDAEVGEAAQKLDPAFFRTLIENPRTPPERLSLFAFLLAGSKDDSQAELLRALIEHPTRREEEAIDGILCGFILLRPKEGWDRVAKLLSDSKQPYRIRSNVMRTVRFFHNWKPKESRADVLRALKGMIETDLIDLAVEDLRRWELFDHSELIFKQYSRPGFDAPIVRRSIIRFALVAQKNAEARPGAERFLKELPTADQQIVKDVAEGLALDRK